jgi:hypothetical protein
MNLLREAASPPKKVQPTPEKPKNWSRPSEWQVANGYEYCADDVWRPQVSREAAGYTVKGEYEVAGKTYNVWRKPTPLKTP